jgi:hypothetical protein
MALRLPRGKALPLLYQLLLLCELLRLLPACLSLAQQQTS